MFKNLFSFEGRIRRTEYGVSFIIYMVAYGILMLIITAAAKSGGVIIALLGLIPMIWFLWSQGAKRCHDLGNSGWWQLIPFYVFAMIFQEGQAGNNQYGENPKGIQSNTNQNYNGSQSNMNSNSADTFGYNGGHNSTSNYQSFENKKESNDGYQNGDLYK